MSAPSMDIRRSGWEQVRALWWREDGRVALLAPQALTAGRSLARGRRGAADVVELDRTAFPSFWQLDRVGLVEEPLGLAVLVGSP